MIHNDGQISAVAQKQGVDGQGVPVLGPNALQWPMPCQLHDPSSFAVAQMSTRGLRLEQVVKVERAALQSAEISITPGDRVSYTRDGDTEPTTRSVLETHLQMGGMIVELRLGERADFVIQEES